MSCTFEVRSQLFTISFSVNFPSRRFPSCCSIPAIYLCRDNPWAGGFRDTGFPSRSWQLCAFCRRSNLASNRQLIVIMTTSQKLQLREKRPLGVVVLPTTKVNSHRISRVLAFWHHVIELQVYVLFSMGTSLSPTRSAIFFVYMMSTWHC